MSQSFDRVRARTGALGVGADPRPTVAPGRGASVDRSVDVQGKAALFSQPAATPTLGTVAITCSQCHDATVVSYLRALQLALPSLHLLVLRRDYPSWMRCPACDRRTWVRIRFA